MNGPKMRIIGWATGTPIRIARVMAAMTAILVLGAAQAQTMIRVGFERSPGTPYPVTQVMCYEAWPGSVFNDGVSYIIVPEIYVSRSPASTGAQYLFYRYSLEYWNGTSFADAGSAFSTPIINNGKTQTSGSSLLTRIGGRSIAVVHGWIWRVRLEYWWTTDVNGNYLIGSAVYRPAAAGYIAEREPLAQAVATIGTWGGYGYCTMP